MSRLQRQGRSRIVTIWAFFMAAAAGFIGSETRAAPAHAAPAAPVVQSLLACRAIAEDAARLACFDKAAAAMGEAESKGDLLTLDRQQRQAARRQAFGLPLPALDILNRGEKREDVDKLVGKVASASRNADGKWVVRLEDGATWRQIDDNTLRATPARDAPVVISKGVLGSYFMKIGAEGAIRVHRDL